MHSSYLDYLYPNNTSSYNSSYNSFGQIGLIQTPSADSRPEGTVSLILNRNDIWKFGTLSVSPFDWLEAGYFYYRPSDLVWEGNLVPGHYLDKGFNIKFIHRPKNKNLPNIAIGLDDFAGTGYLQREYIVSTYELKNTKISLGVGWGKFVGEESIENPLSFISDKLLYRQKRSDNFKSGGSPAYDLWFRGKASIFGGLEYSIPNAKGLKLKLEVDPFNYFDFSANNRLDASFDIRKKESKFNFGLNFPINKFLSIDTSYIKGNTFNLNLSFGITFNDKLSSKPKFKPITISRDNKVKSKKVFYEELLTNLNRNNLFLQTASLNENDSLEISISTSNYRNAIRSSSYASNIANEIANHNKIDLSTINVTHINAGVELNNITYIANYFEENNNAPYEVKILNTNLESGELNDFINDEFKPNVNFPVIFSSTVPSIFSHIGNPEKFYFGGINLENISEIQFRRNLLLSSEINYPLYNNITDTISGAGSNMQHVRTDLVEYLKEDDIFLSRMQLDYIWSPYKDVYAKLSGGIFEAMYGGIGGEILYKPFSKNFSVGLELFHVKQRSFNQRFDFQKYRTTTGHINISYMLGYGIESNLSFGRYLAKDDGYTLDLGRRTDSGFMAGVYFTRTDVSFVDFGEGSFDKGFYFQFPIELLTKQYNGKYSSIKISPLTRDGGAKLIHEKNLKGLIYNSSLYELNRQWSGFLN